MTDATGKSDAGRRDVRWSRICLAVAIGFAVAGLGRLLPFADGVDPAPACRLLFVTGLTTSCWLLSAMPIGAASLLPLALLPILGVQSTAELTSGYGHPILWLFAGGFVLAFAVERCGLHRRVALRTVVAFGPNPRRLVTAFFMAATLLSMWISNTATALLLLPIGIVLSRRAAELGELPPRTQANFSAGIMCAIAFGASIGGMATPIGTAPNALFFAAHEPLVDAGARPVSFLDWLLAFGPYSLLFAWLSSIVLVRVALPVPGIRLQRGEELLVEARALPRWSSAEKRTAILFGAAALLWTTRGDFYLGPGDVLHGWAHYLVPAGERDRFIADGTVAVFVAILAFLIPSGNAERTRLVDWETVRKMPIDLLLLLGGGIAMASAFGPTGLSAAFGELLRPMIGFLPAALLMFVMVLSITALSEIASNTACATMLLPIARDGALAANLDPVVLMAPAVIASSCGFMLPIATPPNTIVFASRQITFGQMARAGIFIDLLAAVLFVPVVLWWGLPILGVDVSTLTGGG